jgi:serpin B
MRNLTVLKIICAVVILQSCSSNVEEEKKFNTITNGETFVKANNKFAFDVFKEVSKLEAEENTMISPVSLSLALGMTYNGAAGETKTAFENTLNYSNFYPTEINTINQEIIHHLASSSSGSLFEIAKSIWVKKDFLVKEEFLDVNKNFYNAAVRNLDFSDANSVNIINDWVSDKTYQKIPKIIEKINPLDVMFLINALYFKSDWKYSFDVKDTEDLPFYGENSTQSVKMMNLTNDLSFYENEYFSSVKLPYKNNKYTMTLFLPNETKTTSDILEVLNTENWEKWNALFYTKEVALKMPKFKFSYEKLLNKALIDMGLGNAFSADANFNGISNENLSISFVIQKTFIEVNEKGTEAAAVTAVGISTTSIDPSKKVMIVNKPFLFSITENETGSICFIGKIGMPKSDN